MFRKRNRRMQCCFCTLLSNLLRSFVCIGSRRGSTESCYRELDLGDEDTLKCYDGTSVISEVSNMVDLQPLSSGLDTDTATLFNVAFRMYRHRRISRRPNKSMMRNVALVDDFMSAQFQTMLDRSLTWQFNAFFFDIAAGGRSLPYMCVHLFKIYGLIDHFKLEVERVWKLFSSIEAGYRRDNPYHNSVHAVDVTQAVHCFLQQDKIRANTKPMEMLATLVAAISHDLDHPGFNVPFLRVTSAHVTQLYDQSTLENHHWRVALSSILQSELLSKVLVGQTREDFINQLTLLILATDITRQEEFLGVFTRHLDDDTLDMTKREHRLLVLQIALKCADISNPCRHWEISRKWSLKVCEEFFRQGDYERELNLPISPLCDRHTESIPRIQTGFFQFVVTPLMKEWHRFLGNELTEQIMRNLVHNQNEWETLLAEEIADKNKNLVVKVYIVEETEDEDETGSMSDSAERLLPLPKKNMKMRMTKKREPRRFAVPKNLFRDSFLMGKLYYTEQKASESSSKVAMDLAEHKGSGTDTKVTPIDQSSTASNATVAQASRLPTVNENHTLQVRQQTGTPLNPVSQHPLLSHSVSATAQDNLTSPKIVASTSGIDKGPQPSFSGRQHQGIADETVSFLGACSTTKFTVETEKFSFKSGLRNVSTESGIVSEPALQHQQSTRAEVVHAPTGGTVQGLAAAFSDKHLASSPRREKEACDKRRGSAPAPLAGPDVAQALMIVNGRCRQSPCHLAAPLYAQARQELRRNSLPVEESRHIEDQSYHSDPNMYVIEM